MCINVGRGLTCQHCPRRSHDFFGPFEEAAVVLLLVPFTGVGSVSSVGSHGSRVPELGVSPQWGWS